jgi:hypothetical protein
MTNFSFPAIRYASDMPFAAGMVLADEHGNTTEVQAVDGNRAVLSGFRRTVRISLALVRQVYPYLVFVTELVADAERREAERVEAEDEADWQEHQEALRVGALAQWAQHEDDLKDAILARAEAERLRKNALRAAVVAVVAS